MLAGVALVVSVGCAGESEEPPLEPTLRVAVSTDLLVDTDADELRITVDRGGSEVFAKGYGTSVLASLPDSLLLENDHRVDDRGDPILTPIVVHVTATLAGEPVVTRSAELIFQNDEAKVLRMPLCAACKGVSCEVGETCVRGACAPHTVDIGSLPADGDDVELAGECALD